MFFLSNLGMSAFKVHSCENLINTFTDTYRNKIRDQILQRGPLTCWGGFTVFIVLIHLYVDIEYFFKQDIDLWTRLSETFITGVWTADGRAWSPITWQDARIDRKAVGDFPHYTGVL